MDRITSFEMKGELKTLFRCATYRCPRCGSLVGEGSSGRASETTGALAAIDGADWHCCRRLILLLALEDAGESELALPSDPSGETVELRVLTD